MTGASPLLRNGNAVPFAEIPCVSLADFREQVLQAM